MGRLVARRLAAMIAVLFGLAVIVFILQAVIPADPVRAMVGASAPPEVVAAERHKLGYDQPLPVRFADYMERLASGDLETSLRTRNPVADDLATFAPATLELALAAAAIAAIVGVGLGLALAAGGRVARVISVGADRGASVATFLTALLLIVLFYSTLHLLPASGRVDPTRSCCRAGRRSCCCSTRLLHGEPNRFWSAFTHILICRRSRSRCCRRWRSRGRSRPRCEQVHARGLRADRPLQGPARAHGAATPRAAQRAGPALTMSGLQFGLLLGGIVVDRADLCLAGPRPLPRSVDRLRRLPGDHRHDAAARHRVRARQLRRRPRPGVGRPADPDGLNDGRARADPRDELPSAGQPWSRVCRRSDDADAHRPRRRRECLGAALRAADPLERYCMPDTLKAQHISRLTSGVALYSDMGRVLASIVARQLRLARHDHRPCDRRDRRVALGGRLGYQEARNDWRRSAREALLVELAKHGLGTRDLVANVNFFTKVGDRRRRRARFRPRPLAPGGAGDAALRARHARRADAATPHPLDPAPVWRARPVRLLLTDSEPAGADDRVRTACPENERGFAASEATLR